MFFKDREDAGKKLAEVCSEKDFSDWEVVGIARGGVIVGLEIAEAFHILLHAICVEDARVGDKVLNATGFGSGLFTTKKGFVCVPDVSTVEDEEVVKMTEQVKRKQMKFNSGPLHVKGKKIIVVDDGMVSGSTAFSAIYSLMEEGVEKVALAIPIVLPWTKKCSIDFELITWRVSTLEDAPTGMFYNTFEDTPDNAVLEAVRQRRE